MSLVRTILHVGRGVVADLLAELAQRVRPEEVQPDFARADPEPTPQVTFSEEALRMRSQPARDAESRREARLANLTARKPLEGSAAARMQAARGRR